MASYTLMKLGFSNKKVLLFMLLVVNKDNKGISIKYLLFSAASRAQRVSSFYNHAILKELLKQYKDKIFIENNHKFLLKITITDINHKERLALLENTLQQYHNNANSKIISIINGALEFIKGDACIHIRAATIWINWLKSQPSQNTYYPNLQHNQLPLITLPSQEETLRLLNKDKDQTKELLLFEQEQQGVYKDDNNTLEDNITSNNKDKTATSIQTTPLSTETTPLTPLDLNTKHSISNDLATVEKSMNRLTHNRPTEVDSDTENIAEKETTKQLRRVS
ncbi:hypothetical protein C1646_812495 [Rhizophagus diaphanus]|nr:hypothetical protein C1646_812495 [Rhizophagus diaphanus] [Rhizophagus sp. MUCL 43196]